MYYWLFYTCSENRYTIYVYAKRQDFTLIPWAGECIVFNFVFFKVNYILIFVVQVMSFEEFAQAVKTFYNEILVHLSAKTFFVQNSWFLNVWKYKLVFLVVKFFGLIYSGL